MRTLSIVTLLALVAACGPSSRPGPTRRHLAVAPDTYAAYVRGRVAFYLGDHEQAIAELDAAARRDPERPDLAVALIEALLAAGDVPRALATAATARRRFPFNARVALAAARAARADGDLEAARNAATRAIALERRLRDAHLLLADIYAARNDIDGELAARRAVVDLWPNWWRGHFLLGDALQRTGRLAGAELHLRIAVDRRPGFLPARMALAATLTRSRRTGEADELLRDTFDRRRGTAAVARRIARDSARDLGPERAIAVLLAIDRDDLTPRTRYAIAEMLLDLAAPDPALAIASALRTRAPANASVAWLEGLCLESAGRPDQAVEAWLRVPIDAATAPRARGRAAIVLAANGQPDRGLAVARELMSRFPDRAESVSALAHATAYASGADSGRVWFDGALTSNPGDRDLSLAAAEFELVWSAPGLAFARVAPLLDDTEDADAANLAGYALVLAGERLDRAGELLSRARELAPDDPAILDSWGLWLLRDGKRERALAALERAAAEMPADPEIALHLGQALLALERTGDARSALARANRLARVGDERVRARARELLESIDRPGPTRPRVP